MRQFVVPQFIDVEDKIIGPITIRQFLLLIVCGLFLFLEFKLSDMALFVVLGLPTFAIFGTIAFFKVNGMPFHYFLLNIIQTLKRSPIRVWSREMEMSAKPGKTAAKSREKTALPPPKNITTSRLSDLALIIDTGGIYQGQEAEKEIDFKL